MNNKSDELLITLSEINPLVLCFSEHRLRNGEINNIHLNQYTLGAHFCRSKFTHGGVAVYVLDVILYHVFDLTLYTRDKDVEACAIKMHISFNNLFVLCIYRSPSGDFSFFLNHLEHVLNKLFKISTNVALCGDFNINFLVQSSRLFLLETLLASFGLGSTVQFPTRNVSDSHSLIDNTFIDKNVHKFFVYPLINGLSDHDAQMLVLLDLKFCTLGPSCSYNRHR